MRKQLIVTTKGRRATNSRACIGTSREEIHKLEHVSIATCFPFNTEIETNFEKWSDVLCGVLSQMLEKSDKTRETFSLRIGIYERFDFCFDDFFRRSTRVQAISRWKRREDCVCRLNFKGFHQKAWVCLRLHPPRKAAKYPWNRLCEGIASFKDVPSVKLEWREALQLYEQRKHEEEVRVAYCLWTDEIFLRKSLSQKYCGRSMFCTHSKNFSPHDLALSAFNNYNPWKTPPTLILQKSLYEQRKSLLRSFSELKAWLQCEMRDWELKRTPSGVDRPAITQPNQSSAVSSSITRH